MCRFYVRSYISLCFNHQQAEPESTPLEGSNPLNDDPPVTVEEFVDDFNVSVGTYADSIQVYMEAVEAVEEANLLGEQVVNLVSGKNEGRSASELISGFWVWRRSEDTYWWLATMRSRDVSHGNNRVVIDYKEM